MNALFKLQKYWVTIFEISLSIMLSFRLMLYLILGLIRR